MRKSLSILLIVWSLTSSAQMMLPAYQGVFSRKVLASGVASNGLSFDGVNDYVSVSSDAKLNITANLTLSAWIYRNATGKDDCIIGKDIWASNNGYSLWIYNDNRLTLRFGNNSRTYQSNTTIPSGKWTHVAATFDGTNAKLYIDGTLSTTTAALAPSSNSGLLYLGTPQDAVGNSAYNFTGILDDVRIWNIALTQAQIQANMNTELFGTESGLVAYYTFNHGIAAGNNTAITTVTDKTANALNGTLTNFTKTGATSNFVVGKVETPIITNGLVLNLDAGNAASYPGTGTTWKDLSGNGNNFELTNGPIFDNANGGSFVLDGLDDYILSTRIPSTGDPSQSHTYSIWVNPNSTGGNIVSMSSVNPQGGWNMPPIVASGSNFGGEIYNNNTIYSSTYNFNNWYHVVLVFDKINSSQFFYVNGVLKGSQAGINYRGSGVDNYLFLGQQNPGYGASGMFKGKIGAFQFYNRALIASEILQNYNAVKARFGY